MGTVRHETVHYTAEEMAAKEAATAAAKAGRQRIMLVACGAIVLVALFGCITCLVMGSLAPSAEPTPRPFPLLATTEAFPTLVLTVTTEANADNATAAAVTPRAALGPVILAEVSGSGNVVTENFMLPQCQKAVFYWSVEPNPHGSAGLIIHLWNTAKDYPVHLVSEYETDRAGGIEGEVLQPLKGGEYYFAAKSTTGSWAITVQCKD